MQADQLSYEMWKATLEAHDRLWSLFALVALGITAAISTELIRGTPRFLRTFFIATAMSFLVVVGLSMKYNLQIHNDATDSLKNLNNSINDDKNIGEAGLTPDRLTLRRVGHMDINTNTLIVLVFGILLFGVMLCMLKPWQKSPP